MSDEENKTRATTGVKFSAFKQVGPMEGNPVEVVGLRDGENVRANLTTDLVETNPDVTFRNAKGQFAAVDPGVLALTNQLKVNRYFYERLAEIGVPIGENPPSETPQDGAFWFDNSEDVMQLFMWHAESDAWIPIAPPTTLEGRVATGETTQAAIIDQIQESLAEQETIKNKVAALEGAVGDHSLVFTTVNSNPREGEFNLKDGAMQLTNTLASADYITLSDTDRDGKAIDLERITEGDVLRFSSIDGQAAELKITDGTEGVYAFTKISGDLDRLSEYPYDFILLSSFDPAGLATIDYVDAENQKYLPTSGMAKGDTDHFMTGSIRTNRGVGYIWYEKDGVGQDGDRVSQLWNNGDKLQLDVQNGHKLQILGSDGSGTKTFLTVQNSNNSGVDGVDYKMNLYHVAEPSSPQHAATKNYVDAQIAEAIANLNRTAMADPQPAYLMWEYQNRGDSAPPQDGEFFKNNDWWHFSYKTKNGVDIGGGPPSEKEWYAPQGGDCKYEMTLWEVTDGVWRMYKHIECYKASWSRVREGVYYFAFKHTWQSHDNSCQNGHKYFVTVGGWF